MNFNVYVCIYGICVDEATGMLQAFNKEEI